MPYLSLNSHYSRISAVLICGNTQLLSAECLKVVAHSFQVIVAGENNHPDLKTKQISFYQTRPGEEKFSFLFDAYSIDAVWYISGNSDVGHGILDENRQFQIITGLCEANAVKKLIVVSSLEALNYQPVYGEAGQLVKKDFADVLPYQTDLFENLVLFLTKDIEATTIILRCPYIADTDEFSGYLGALFQNVKKEKKVTFPYRPENQIDFISAMDLTELLILITEESGDEKGSYNVASGFFWKYSDLERILKEMDPELSVQYDEKLDYIGAQHFSIGLKRKYGFIPSDNVPEKIHEYYEKYSRMLEKQNPFLNALKKVYSYLTGKLMMVVELVIFGILMELLVRNTGDSVYFKYVDIRLFYVLLLGSVHGMAGGLSAGLIAGLSLVGSYDKSGITGTMLFYNIEYWIPFIIYLMTGLVTGYTRSAAAQQLAFCRHENQRLTDKYHFLLNLYQVSVNDTQSYKKQILSHRDSFGKIYESVQQLDALSPDQIFLNGIDVLEKILENRSVAIYTVDRNGIFGRLTVCSPQLSGKLRSSIRLEDYASLTEVIREEKVWRNTEFREHMPFFAAGINDGNGQSMIIMLYHVTQEQQALYYQNLFQMVCNLIRISFLRAMKYQEAIEEKKYYPGTRILYPVFYENILKTQLEMEEKGVSVCTELLLESKDIGSVAEKVETNIRNTDYCGCDEEGNIHILLTQTDEETFDRYVAERLKKQFAFRKVRNILEK